MAGKTKKPTKWVCRGWETCAFSPYNISPTFLQVGNCKDRGPFMGKKYRSTVKGCSACNSIRCTKEIEESISIRKLLRDY